MCGIFAVLTQTPQPKPIIDASKVLSKRGPDKTVTLVKSNGIFVFNRLAINDLSSNGDQPMCTKTLTMMCNGEIYNYKDLIREHKLKCESTSDCEVILRLTEKIGFVETVRKLDGVFAIILVDGENVYLARDRIGVRPLFTGWVKGEKHSLAVASTPNALLPFCDDVGFFPPGTVSKLIPYSRELFPLFRDELSMKVSVSNPQLLKNALIKAVEKRLISDRPIGCLLSGGLDSSIIASILVKLIGKEKVRTYSIGMDGSTDLHYARMVANYLGTTHTEVKFTPEEGFNVIPEVINSLASYDITTIRASVGMYLLCKYIKENTTDRVIFSGEGSDELLCGYLYFHNAPTPIDACRESLRLTQSLHSYDVLRADRMISDNGLELREPFLDRSVVDIALSLDPELKAPNLNFTVRNIEKKILREQFVGFLPHEVLWRQKCAFSDGVSAVKKSWKESIQKFVEEKISDSEFDKSFPSKEAMYYKRIFDQLFPTYSLKLEYWMPRWSNATSL